MKKKNLCLTLVLMVTFVLAPVQLTFADDLIMNHAPKVINVNTVIYGSLKDEDDEDCYSFYSGGGKYNVLLYTKTPYIDEDFGEIDMNMALEYGQYSYYSVNKGWQMPEYQCDGSHLGLGFQGTEDTDGWYVCSIPIGKYKAGKRVGIGISSEYAGEYKFEVVGNAFAAPAKPVVRSVKGKKHSMTVKWKKAANAKGYVIQISRYKGWGDNYKEVRVSGSSVSRTLKSLKSGTYYVKMCSYKKVNGVTAYSDWTKAKKVIVK